MKETRPTRKMWFLWLLFSLLCLWGATRWLLPGSEITTAQARSALAAGTLLAASCAWGLASRDSFEPVSRRALLQAAGGGACWLLGIQLPQLLPATDVGSTSKTIALALCPVVIAVVESALRRAEAPDLPGRLWPGLAAVAGLLLLLPEPSLANWKQVLVLFGMPLLAGIGAALIASVHGPGRRTDAFALAGACVPACAVALLQFVISSGEFSLMAWRSFLLQAGEEAVSLLLAFRVMSSLGALRWSASLVIVPLLVALQGVVLLRPELGARAFLGMGLLALASLFLLGKPIAVSVDNTVA